MGIIDQINISKQRIRECQHEISQIDLVIERYRNNFELQELFQNSKDDLETEIAENKKFLAENGESFP